MLLVSLIAVKIISFLENTVSFYEQFEAEVQQRLDSLKKPIEKEIKVRLEPKLQRPLQMCESRK